MIINPRVESYINSLIPERTPLLQNLEQQAKEEEIPIMQLSSMHLVSTLLALKQPKRVLEVGTAIGYSTIWLAKAAPHARITTMEIDSERVNRALENLEHAGVRERVEVIEGDARDGLPNHYKFDVLFFDAAKGQYQTYFDLYFPLLEDQGLLLCDNVLFRGMVAEDKLDTKRYKQMVEKLKDFNLFLTRHPMLELSIVPIGDGLAVGVKRGETDEKA